MVHGDAYVPDDLKLYRRHLRCWYKEQKSKRSCVYCGGRKHLEFHHLTGSKKVASVSRMVHDLYPQELIEDEIDKCILLCRKCHGREHQKIDEMNRRASSR